MPFKRLLKRMKKAAVKYFRHERIIRSGRIRPAKLIRKYTRDGVKYVQVGFTNRRRTVSSATNVLPVMEIPAKDIDSIELLPSKFDKHMAWLVGGKAKSKIYHFKK